MLALCLKTNMLSFCVHQCYNCLVPVLLPPPQLLPASYVLPGLWPVSFWARTYLKGIDAASGFWLTRATLLTQGCSRP